jgi:hypothetical protein
MPFNYNLSAEQSPSVTDNLQPIVPPVVNRFFHTWGLDYNAGSVNGGHSIHIPINHIAFAPIKMASTVSVNQASMYVTAGNGTVDTWTYDLALYTNNVADSYPASKIADLGTYTWQPGVTSAGPQTLTIDQQFLMNTVYWIGIGIRASGSTDYSAGLTPKLHQQTGDFSMYRKRGLSSVSSGSAGMAWTQNTGTYAGTMPATATYSTPGSTPLFPRILFRRSA